MIVYLDKDRQEYLCRLKLAYITCCRYYVSLSAYLLQVKSVLNYLDDINPKHAKSYLN